MTDKPVIGSLSQVDFYKLTTQQLALLSHPDVDVTFGYKQRSAARVADLVPIEAVREEIEHVRTLRFTPDDLGWLGMRKLEDNRVFQPEYLDFLSGLALPECEVGLREDVGAFSIESAAVWQDVTLWETLWLNIVNTLYYRALLKSEGISEEAAWREGDRRLDEKFAILKQNPDLVFVEFGNRRAFSPEWQAHVDQRICEELGDQCIGISNVALARQFGKEAAGTYPHEGPVVFQGIFQDLDDRMGRMYSQELWFDAWFGMYGAPLSVALTDTYTTEYHMRTFGEKRFQLWRSQRLDSGDLEADGERIYRHYRTLGIDAKKKRLVPSDGMELPSMLAFRDRFVGRIGQIPGWGTNLTNDLGFDPLSHVAKPIFGNGFSLVKISNNPLKATGTPEAIARVKRLIAYDPTTHNAAACKY